MSARAWGTIFPAERDSLHDPDHADTRIDTDHVSVRGVSSRPRDQEPGHSLSVGFSNTRSTCPAFLPNVYIYTQYFSRPNRRPILSAASALFAVHRDVVRNRTKQRRGLTRFAAGYRRTVDRSMLVRGSRGTFTRVIVVPNCVGQTRRVSYVPRSFTRPS